MQVEKHIGHVKWFNEHKGYGFLLKEGKSKEDIFFHFSAVQVPGYKTLDEGQRVCFELERSEQGWMARHIVPIAE